DGHEGAEGAEDHAGESEPGAAEPAVALVDTPQGDPAEENGRQTGEDEEQAEHGEQAEEETDDGLGGPARTVALHRAPSRPATSERAAASSSAMRKMRSMWTNRSVSVM